MIEKTSIKRTWKWTIAVTFSLPLITGCAPLNTDNTLQFFTDLLLNAAAALL
ncbi:MAG: hypothetical protein JSW66_07130 [Phycisphaerales bacterium]|nr:MAG: hypothetical protein JSW66_07130 [Phycisphaerales bacterium]